MWAEVLFLERAGFFSLSHPDQLWDFHTPLSNRCRAFFLGGKMPAHDIDHSLAFSPEIRNSWIFTFIPPVYLHGNELGHKEVTELG
jgi:hypothetical protein